MNPSDWLAEAAIGLLVAFCAGLGLMALVLWVSS
jgi:hypothetical protein